MIAHFNNVQLTQQVNDDYCTGHR